MHRLLTMLAALIVALAIGAGLPPIGASASVPTTTVAVSHTFSQPPPPVGNDPNTGEPNLPCTPDIDGYLYLTTTADGADHKFVCGPDRAGKFRWIEIA